MNKQELLDYSKKMMSLTNLYLSDAVTLRELDDLMLLHINRFLVQQQESWWERLGRRIYRILFDTESYDLVAHLNDQKGWSRETFGPGPRVEGILDHMEKEMREIRSNPKNLEEWIDMAMLAFDGAWRSLGDDPDKKEIAKIAETFWLKLEKNKNREWPDWRESDPDKAIEHSK